MTHFVKGDRLKALGSSSTCLLWLFISPLMYLLQQSIGWGIKRNWLSVLEVYNTVINFFLFELPHNLEMICIDSDVNGSKGEQL